MTQARERRARKHLKRLGYKLQKTPPRHPDRAKHGVGYMIADDTRPVHGRYFGLEGPGTVQDFRLSLEGVENFIDGLATEKIEEDLSAALRKYRYFGGTDFTEVAQLTEWTA